MRLTLVAVGRARAGPLAELFEEYRRRCPWPIRLVEVAARNRLAPARARAEEARLLLDSVPAGALVVALDESGARHPRAT